MRIQNPSEHLKRSFYVKIIKGFQPLILLAKCLHLDVWQDSGCSSEMQWYPRYLFSFFFFSKKMSQLFGITDPIFHLKLSKVLLWSKPNFAKRWIFNINEWKIWNNLSGSLKGTGVARIWNKYLKISWKLLTLMTSHWHPTKWRYTGKLTSQVKRL